MRKIWALFLLFLLAAVAASSAQTLTTLYNFCSQSFCPNGSYPYGALLQGADGNFYGTTAYDGTGYAGTVYKITPAGAQTVIYNFCSQPNCTDGATPIAGVIQGTNGSFYGTTYYGGLYSNTGGTVFAITPGGTLSSLYSFCRQPNCSDGAEPGAGLILAADGNFYGTTSIKGAGHGTVFRTTQSGTLTTLHSFTGTDGSEANALIQATDGSFYGTAYGGGANNSCTPGGCGTVFKISPSGMLTTLYNFCSRPNCIDGFQPGGGLVQGADGNFYGTTYGGGTGSGGTIFKITASGALTTLYSFCSAPNCADGFGPGVGLIQATDGNFYGTTVGGGTGAVGGGTIFKIAPNGMLTTLYSFCSQSNCADGSNPEAALLQATDGNFYGTTANGGNSANCHSAPAGCGTVFRLSTGLGPFVETQPTSGSPGTPVTIPPLSALTARQQRSPRQLPKSARAYLPARQPAQCRSPLLRER
jgi:uncharacterized repeat protein (TIGR03803 family)